MRKLTLLPLLVTIGIVFGACAPSWTWLWQNPSFNLPGALGLGDNNQSWVTLDGAGADVTIETSFSNSLESESSACINAGEGDTACVFNKIGAWLTGAFADIEKAAVADANCVGPFCTYGVSLTQASIGFFSIGGGCLGFKVGADFFNGVYYRTMSWFYMNPSINGGSGDPPANAFCSAT